jgi:DNA-binding CsgD family transcriptional regulator
MVLLIEELGNQSALPANDCGGVWVQATEVNQARRWQPGYNAPVMKNRSRKSADPLKGLASAIDQWLRHAPVRQMLTRGRLRVFQALLLGLSEFEVAKKLRLSRHTVHEYVKEIYQRLEVGKAGVLSAQADWARETAPRSAAVPVSSPMNVAPEADSVPRTSRVLTTVWLAASITETVPLPWLVT